MNSSDLLLSYPLVSSAMSGALSSSYDTSLRFPHPYRSAAALVGA